MTNITIVNLTKDQRCVSDFILNNVFNAKTSPSQLEEIFISPKKLEDTFQNDVAKLVDKHRNAAILTGKPANAPKKPDAIIVISEDLIENIKPSQEYQIYQCNEKLGHEHLHVNTLLYDNHRELRKVTLSMHEYNKLRTLEGAYYPSQYEEAYHDFINQAYTNLPEFLQQFTTKTELESYQKPIIVVEQGNDAFIYSPNENILTNMSNTNLSFLMSNTDSSWVSNTTIKIKDHFHNNTVSFNINDRPLCSIIIGSNASQNAVICGDGPDLIEIKDNAFGNIIFTGNGFNDISLDDNVSFNIVHGGDENDFFEAVSCGIGNIINGNDGQDLFKLLGTVSDSDFNGGNDSDFFLVYGSTDDGNQMSGGNGDDYFFDANSDNTLNGDNGHDTFVVTSSGPSDTKNSMDRLKIINAGSGDDMIILDQKLPVRFARNFSSLFTNVRLLAELKNLRFSNFPCYNPKTILNITLGSGQDKFFISEKKYLESQIVITDYNPEEDILCFDNQTTAYAFVDKIRSDYRKGRPMSVVEHQGAAYNFKFNQSLKRSPALSIWCGVYNKDNIADYILKKDFNSLQKTKIRL